jgi:PAS domain S-box-containing protein
VSEQKARAIFDSSFSLIGYLAMDGTLLDVNHTALELIGARPVDVIGKFFWDCPWWNHDAHVQAQVKDAIARGTLGEVVRFETTHPTPDGEMRDIEFTLRPVRDEQGYVTALIPEARDITENKWIKRELIRARIEAERYLRIAEVILVALDRDGLVTMLNPKGYSVLGYAEPELMGKNWFDVTLRNGEVQKAKDIYAQVISGALVRPEHFERAVVRKDNEHRLISWGTTVIRDDDGLILGILGSGEDITDRHQEEQQRRLMHAQIVQAQKMESMGILAGGVAHDMNNVLAAILGMAEIGLEKEVEGTPGHHALSTIIKAAERGGSMVKSLLAFARRGPTEQRNLDLNQIITENVRLLERTTLSRVNLQLFLQAELPHVTGDPSALASVFMNLCVNAVDAMADGGTITIRTRNVQDIWVEALVEDTGEGMTDEVRLKALDPFFTTKEAGKGTGLGLSTVHSTITAHQGEMDIESALGVGTRIVLRLPISGPITAGPLPSWERRKSPRGPHRQAFEPMSVLFVDDDDLVCSAAKEVLKRLGHTVTTTGTAEEALEILDFHPDVVILDMNMPGMGGAAMLPRLRALHPTLPVVISTGKVDDAVLNLVEQHRGVSLLSKPYSMKALEGRLNETLNRD